MNGEDARQPEWGFEMRTQSDTDRPTTEPRTDAIGTLALKAHLAGYTEAERKAYVRGFNDGAEAAQAPRHKGHDEGRSHPACAACQSEGAAPRAEGLGEHLPYQPIYLDGGGDPDFRTIDAYLRTHFNAHAEYNEAAPRAEGLDVERLAEALLRVGDAMQLAATFEAMAEILAAEYQRVEEADGR